MHAGRVEAADQRAHRLPLRGRHGFVLQQSRQRLGVRNQLGQQEALIAQVGAMQMRGDGPGNRQSKAMQFRQQMPFTPRPAAFQSRPHVGVIGDTADEPAAAIATQHPAGAAMAHHVDAAASAELAFDAALGEPPFGVEQSRRRILDQFGVVYDDVAITLPHSNVHIPLTDPPQSVCLLRLSAIGDVCNAVPLVRRLQAAWPRTAFTWLIGAVERSLVGDIPGIEFLTYDKRSGLLEGVRPAQLLAGRRFDLLLHLQASWRANALAWRVDAPVKLGFDRARARDGQWLFTNRRIAPRPRETVALGFQGFADALGLPPAPPRWDIPLSAADRAFAQQHVARPQGALLISPCSSQRARNFRNWPAERYADIARCAMERHGLGVILTGGRTELEREYARRIRELAGDAVVDLVGQTSLKQLLALIERAAAVLAPDSGPVHMASAVGTPAIGLYATSNPARTGPMDARWVVSAYDEALRIHLNKGVEGVRWGQRVRDPDAMALIGVEAVLGKLSELMDAPLGLRRPPWWQ